MALSDLMDKVKAGGEDVNPAIFLTICGSVIKNIEGQPMDGQNQEDAHGFWQSLVEHLATEHPNAKIEGLFQISLGCAMDCKECKTRKTLYDTDLTLNFPESRQPNGAPMSITELLKQALEDISKFDELTCEKCETKGDWIRPEGWTSKRLTKAPTYLQVPISRQTIDMRSGQVVKVKTPLDISPEPIKLTMDDGTDVKYELVSSIHHIATE